MSPSPPYVEQIREALGAGWQALLVQQTVIGVQQIVFALVLLVLAAAAVKLAQAPLKAWTGGGNEDDLFLPVISVVVLFVLALCAFLLGLGLVMDAIGHLVNPTGYAVQGIIDALGSHGS